MALPINFNLVNCGAGGTYGSGLAGCRIDRKRIVALALLQKGTLITGDFDKDYFDDLVLSGKLLYFPNVVSFTDNTPEDNIDTAEGSGYKSVISKRPYEYTVVFNNGYKFQSAVTSASGYGNYDLILVDVDNQWWMTESLQGDAKGFSLTMHEGGNYKGQGSEKASETFTLQLANRLEVDVRMGHVHPLDFDYNDVDGVNQTTLVIDPITAGTSVSFTAFLSDMSHAVLGLTPADVKVTVNGTPVNPSALVYNGNKATLTVAALTTGQIVTIGFKNATYTSGIYQHASGVSYQTVTEKAVVL